MTRPVGAWRRRLRGLSAALVSTILLLTLVELGARWLGPDRDGEVETGIVEPDPHLLWRLAPRAEGPLATNEIDLRDRPYRADADRTILALGDSVTWGDGIPEVDVVFPQVLEDLLRERLPGETWEVINAGVPGYSTFQELSFLERHGPALEPDAVLLTFCLNDVVERYHELGAYGGDGRFLGIDTRVGRGGLLRRSRALELALRLAQGKARSRQEYDVRKLAADGLSPELERAWSLVLRELDGVDRAAREAGIPLLLAVSPYAFQLEAPEELRQPQDRLLAHARRRGFACLDLLPGFAAEQRRRGLPLFFDANHLSRAGHRAAAELLVEPILTLLGENREPAGEALLVDPPDGGE